MEKWKVELQQRLIEMPKDGLLVRPLCLIHPRHRVVYWAIVNRLAPAVDAVLSDSVFSARLRPKKGQMTGQIQVLGRRAESPSRSSRASTILNTA